MLFTTANPVNWEMNSETFLMKATEFYRILSVSVFITFCYTSATGYKLCALSL